MRRIAFAVFLAIVTMVGSLPASAATLASVREVSGALSVRTAQLLASLPKAKPVEKPHAPVRTHSVQAVLACMNRTLSANGLTQQTARNLSSGATIRVETGMGPSLFVEYRLVRGDTVWGSCVKVLKAVPAAQMLAKARRAKALAAVWKSIARPPQIVATTASTARATVTVTPQLLAKKNAVLKIALAAVTAQVHVLTEKVTRLQDAVAKETAKTQRLNREVATLAQSRKPTLVATSPANSVERNRGVSGDMLVKGFVSALVLVALLLALVALGLFSRTRRVVRCIARSSRNPRQETEVGQTERNTHDHVHFAQSGVQAQGSTIRFRLNPVWIEGKREPVPIETTVTKVVYDGQGAPVVLKGHAPWDFYPDGTLDESDGDSSIVLAHPDPRTGKTKYATKPLASQIACALDPRFNRSPTTRRIHDWFRQNGLQLRQPRGHVFFWKWRMLRAPRSYAG